MKSHLRQGMMLAAGSVLLLAGGISPAAVNRPFPQAGSLAGYELKPDNLTPTQLNAAVSNYYFYWKTNYLAPSVKVAGDYKVNYDGTGATVSEAMGYGMLLTAYLAGADPEAKNCFDGLNRFRKRYPSNLNPALMCWKIPANENPVSDDCATDGDLDMALALLLAHRQWGDATYLVEATNYLNRIAAALVRSDYSLRLGDWNSAAGQTRPSDFMPAHFRGFYLATGNGFWTNVESRCYFILDQLQTNYAAATGLVPDFATNNGGWKPAKAGFLEGPNDGSYYYNSCRVPWRIGWAAWAYNDARARQVLSRFMAWTVSRHAAPVNFRAGYKLDGSNLTGNGYDTACFISPTGVAAMVTTNQTWLNSTFAYAKDRKEGYYEDSVSLLSMLVMSGNAWLLTPAASSPKLTQIVPGAADAIVLSGQGVPDAAWQIFASTDLFQPFSNWMQINSGIAIGGLFTTTDTQAGNYSNRFYRVATP
jgi:endo-1,4-beta-D-glucanase Y